MLQNNTGTGNAQEKVFDIRVSPLPGYVPPPYYEGRFKDCGDFLTEVTCSGRTLTHVKRIDESHYLVPSTGEVREYRKAEPDEAYRKRIADLWRCFDGLKAVLRKNFPVGAKNALFVTLTYRYPMNNPKLLMKDYQQFFQRLRRAFPALDFDYVSVVEPHGSGTFHIHLILKANNTENLFLPYQQVNEAWGKGFTDTRRLKSDDVGRYYTAYFTGAIVGAEIKPEVQARENEYDSSEQIFMRELALVENANGEQPKSYKKGARLHFYPKGMKIYRCSNGIEKPEPYTAIRGEPDSSLALEHSKAFQIEQHFLQSTKKHKKGDTVILNKIYKATYRKPDSSPIGDPDTPPWAENCVIQAKRSIWEQSSLSLDENFA